MGSNEPNQNDPAGELHAEIVRRRARTHRQTVRALAVTLDSRGWPAARIIELLEIEPSVLERALAVDGRSSCTECIFGRHDDCLDFHYPDALDAEPCECECRASSATR